MLSRIAVSSALAGFGLVGAAWIGNATSIPSVPLEQVIAEARSIFVGRIIQITPIQFEFEGQKHVCGFRYKAEVEREFKNATKVIEFFDPSDEDRLALGDRFLAFLFSYDVARHEREASTMQFEIPLRKAEYVCEIKWIAVTVKEVPRTLLRLSGEWIAIPHKLAPSDEVRLRPVDGRNQMNSDDLMRRIERILAGQRSQSELDSDPVRTPN